MKKIIIILFISTLYISSLHSQTWTYYTNNWDYGTGAGGFQSNPIMVDFYGNLWVVNLTGELWKYDIIHSQWLSFSNIISDQIKTSIFVDSEKSIWLSTFQDYIYHFDGENIIRHYTTDPPYWDGLYSDYVDILVDGNEHVVAAIQRQGVGFENGFLEYYPVKEDPFQWWNHHCILCPDQEELICTAMESNGQVLWFGDRLDGITRVIITNYDAIYRWFGAALVAYIAIGFNNTKYIAINDNAGWLNIGCLILSNNYNTSSLPETNTSEGPFHILIDNDNRKWFSTFDMGAAVFDGTNWTYYSTNEGMAHQRVLAIAQTMDGDYWFFHPNRISRLRLPGREGFQLVSFANNWGENNGASEYMTITGTGFRQGAKVLLRKDGESDIKAIETIVIDGHTMQCKFNLSGAALGQWHVVAYNRYRWPHFNYKFIKENIYEVKEAPDDAAGTEEGKIEDSYLYPNVINGERKISINKIPEKVKIKIYNRIGDKLKEAEVTLKDNEVDISDLSLTTGIYYVIAEDTATGDTKVLKFLFVK